MANFIEANDTTGSFKIVLFQLMNYELIISITLNSWLSLLCLGQSSCSSVAEILNAAILI